MSNDKEKEIIKSHFPTLADNTIDKILSFSNLIRDAVEKRQLKADWSLRTILPWIRLSLIYGDMGEGLRSTYYDKLDDAEKGAVRGFWTSVDFEHTL
jgi:hypothetical protein